MRPLGLPGPCELRVTSSDLWVAYVQSVPQPSGPQLSVLVRDHPVG
jgi:hypothetical protein